MTKTKFSIEATKKQQNIPQEKAVEYWLLVDPATLNPVRPGSGVCWAYYPGDKPAETDRGVWIKVRATGETNQD